MSELSHIRPSNFCDACAIRNRAICADLDDTEISMLNQIGRQQKLEAGDQLLWEGDEAVLVANVVDGILKMSSHTADGREQILGIAFPSDFIGRPFGDSTPFGVEALTDAQVCVFPRTDFDRFAREHPKLEHRLLKRTLTELDRTRRWMLLLGRMNAEQKIANFLIECADRQHLPVDAEEMVIDLPLTRQQIGDLLGLTIETVSRQFTKMRKEGLIDLPSRRQVAILDRERLEDSAT